MTNFTQPSIDLKFDIWLQIVIGIPPSPGELFSLTSTIEVQNISVATDLFRILTPFLFQIFFGGDLTVFSNGSVTIDETSQLNLSQLTGALAFIPQVRLSASALGFKTLTASIPSNALKIQLIHPQDDGPQAWITSRPPFPILSTAYMTTVPEASAGNTIQVSCFDFPVAQST